MNIPLLYKIPARAPTAAQKELKMEVSTGPELCRKQTVAYENIKGSDASPKKCLIYEEMKEETNKRRNKRSSPSCPVKVSLVIAFIIEMIVVVSIVIALFLQIKTLNEMNRALQKTKP